MKTRYISIGIGLALMAAGCSSAKAAGTSTTTPATTTSAAPTTTASTASTATVAQEFLAAAKGADAAYVQWKAAVAGKTEVSQITAPATTYAAQLTTFDNAIMRLGASGKAATDIHTLVSDDGVVIGELNSESTQTQGSLAQWASQLIANGATAIQAGDAVRADLGLPPS